MKVVLRSFARPFVLRDTAAVVVAHPEHFETGIRTCIHRLSPPCSSPACPTLSWPSVVGVERGERDRCLTPTATRSPPCVLAEHSAYTICNSRRFVVLRTTIAAAESATLFAVAIALLLIWWQSLLIRFTCG